MSPSTTHRISGRAEQRLRFNTMRDEYLKNAMKVIEDPNILINVVSLRVKQLRFGHRPLVESLEKLALEDIALREVAEGRITFELATPEEIAALL